MIQNDKNSKNKTGKFASSLKSIRPVLTIWGLVSTVKFLSVYREPGKALVLLHGVLSVTYQD